MYYVLATQHTHQPQIETGTEAIKQVFNLKVARPGNKQDRKLICKTRNKFNSLTRPMSSSSSYYCELQV